MKQYASVDEYIAQAPKELRKTLEEVREVVKKAAPRAIEGIAYGMPAYTWNSQPLFYFAAMKGHLGLYPTPGPIKSCAKLLENFSTSKGCVRVPYTTPTPKAVIIALIKERKREIKD
jgi:uncharacterized protein YdhG (YjbR/CyaY superfamily)